jgi:glycosyltransferase involved in cell wall biosynthesis
MQQMNDCRPLVTIGMPVYNGGKYIRQALDSLLAQDYPNFEIIISDNASKDDTAAICREYVEKDNRLIYLRNQQNHGAPYNFKKVLDESNGEFFMWASCHDVWEPEFVRRCVQPLIDKSTLILCFPSANWICLDGRLAGSIPCSLDTQGLEPLCRALFVLSGLQYAYPVYGIFRSKYLKKIKIDRKLIGADVVTLFEMAFLGEFYQVSDTLIHIRQTEDFGSWQAYVQKIYNSSIEDISFKKEVWKMIFAHLAIVFRHCGYSFKLAPMLIAVFCNAVLKYRYLL